MVEFRPAGLGVWFWVGFVAFVPFSTICLFFPSFNDDLGTMPTRRPYSWKKLRVTVLVALISCSLPANQQVKHEYCIREEGREMTKGTKVPPGHPPLPLFVS